VTVTAAVVGVTVTDPVAVMTGVPVVMATVAPVGVTVTPLGGLRTTAMPYQLVDPLIVAVKVVVDVASLMQVEANDPELDPLYLLVPPDGVNAPLPQKNACTIIWPVEQVTDCEAEVPVPLVVCTALTLPTFRYATELAAYQLLAATVGATVCDPLDTLASPYSDPWLLSPRSDMLVPP
jgi:hypothetical protein